MESSACRRRGSDAEQPARSYPYTVPVEFEPVAVKEEPEWGECGVSEAAAAEGLYDGHEVKDELVIGPELIRQQGIAFSTQDVLNMKKENQHEAKTGGADAAHAAAATEGLYAGHKVKDELVTGPEVVQQQDINYSTHNIKEENQREPKSASGADAAAGCIHTCPGDGPRCNRSTEQQRGLRNCIVRLERFPAGDLHISTPFSVSRDGEPSHSLAPSKLKPVHCGVGNSRAREVPASCQPQPGDERFRAKPKLTQNVQLHTSERPYGCDKCEQLFEQKSELNSHIRQHLGKKYSCNVFAAVGTLISHKVIHTGEKPYSCDVCNKRFTLKTTLTRHKKLVHTGVKPYSCNVCNKQFIYELSFIGHMRAHTDEKPFSCDECNERFKTKSRLVQHVRIHTGERPYGCDTCGQRFKQRPHLLSHFRKHTGEKPYSCDVCNKRFAAKVVLTRHKLIHTGEKPYSCDECNKRFRVKTFLTNHKLTHTGEKPYICDVCGKRFTTSSVLTRHMQIHTHEKRYSCDVCNKSFSRNSDLSKHMQTHTHGKMGKRYSCDVCNKRFKGKSQLTRHVRTHTCGKARNVNRKNHIVK